MDFLRGQLARLNNNSGKNNDKGNKYGYDHFGPTIVIPAGKVEEDVHYMESKGVINLSHLRFRASNDDQENNGYSNFNIYNKFNSNNNYNHNSNAITSNNNSITSNNNSTNLEGSSGGYNNDGGSSRIESFLDIAVFEVPEHCTSRNCDISKFGVGSLSHFNGMSYLTLCQAGRLKLDHNLFKGHHTQLMVPIEGPMPDQVKQYRSAKFSVPKNKHYEVILANCHQRGRNVCVSGQVVFDLMGGNTMFNNLTAKSVTILTSVAVMVFFALTILAVRVNRGTRSDFEQDLYGLVSSTDDDGNANDGETEEEQTEPQQQQPQQQQQQ
mmetsp:Transcript_10558/g.20874  ORF Transcript_10558/g.20874 Transcript_10558/m.20874 type:complete len:325 (+) Transcript_10558:107-1081(+)